VTNGEEVAIPYLTIANQTASQLTANQPASQSGKQLIRLSRIQVLEVSENSEASEGLKVLRF